MGKLKLTHELDGEQLACLMLEDGGLMMDFFAALGWQCREPDRMQVIIREILEHHDSSDFHREARTFLRPFVAALMKLERDPTELV